MILLVCLRTQQETTSQQLLSLVDCLIACFLEILLSCVWGHWQNILGQLNGFWLLRFYLSSYWTTQNFLHISFQKTSPKPIWYFHTNSTFLFYMSGLDTMQSCSQKYYGLVFLPILKIDFHSQGHWCLSGLHCVSHVSIHYY